MQHHLNNITSGFVCCNLALLQQQRRRKHGLAARYSLKKKNPLSFIAGEYKFLVVKMTTCKHQNASQA